MVKLKINGKTVEGKEGDTILDVAESYGIYIPTLCNHPQLTPFGGCRLCLVKVVGMKNYVPSCSTHIREGMIVYTDIEELNRLRRNILELILSEHPSACIVCEDRELCFEYNREPTKAGTITGCRFCPNKDECELYKIAQHLGIKDIRLEIEYKSLPVKKDDYFIERDYNLCVLCGRCVRVCSEIRGVHAIEFTYRGHNATIGTSFDKPLIESECIFCGACVDVCPTGAISEKMLKWGGKPDKITNTTCLLCSAGCNVDVKSKWDKVINVASPPESINKGELCVKGRFVIPPLVNYSERIRYPMIRKNGILEPVSWGEAILYTAEKLKRYRGNIEFVISPWLTNEAAYIIEKFARTIMATDSIIIASDMFYTATDPLIKAFGYCGPKGRIEDIDVAESILIVGTDLNLTVPVLLVSIYRAKKRGAEIIMIDREAKKIPNYVDHYISPENYEEFFSSVLRSLKNKDVSHNDFEKVARSIKGKKTVVILGEGLRGEEGSKTIALICNIISSDSTILPAWNSGNLQGVIDMGAVSGLLPGQYSIRDKDAKKRIEDIWGLDIEDKKSNTVKALYLTQPVLNIPDVDFLVLQTVFNTELIEKADVIFPDVAFTESSGTVTNLERRVQRINSCTKPEAMAVDLWKIIVKIAEKMGEKGFEYKNVNEITEEIFKCIPDMKLGLYKKDLSIKPVDLNSIQSIKHGYRFPDGKITYRGCYMGNMVNDFDSIISEWGYIHE